MYHRHYLIFIFLVQTIYIQAQEFKLSPVVSDTTKVFITSSDSVKAIKRLLNKTIRIDKDTARTIAYQKLFLERGITTHDSKIQFYSAYRLGYYYNELSDYNNAAKYSQISLQAATIAKDTTYMIRSQVLLGNIYFQLGIYDKSLEPYQEAQTLSQSTGNKVTALICLSNIGNIRVKLGRYQDALNVYTETLSLLETEDYKTESIHKQTYLSTLLGKGKSQAELGFLDESLKSYKKGIELSKVYNLPIYKGEFYLNIGNLYYKRGQNQPAIDYLQRAKQLLSEHYNNTYINILITNYYLAQCFYVTQQYDEAMQLLQLNFDVIGTNYKTDKIVEMYDLGIKIAEIQEDKDQQLSFLNQSKLLSKLKLENQTKTRDLLFDNDVKTLEDHNKQLDLEKEKQELKKRIAAALAIGMLLLLLATWIRYKRKIKSNEKKF
jgi:tetratricopeptide (TPR) repeat protein